jgi:flagellar biosynthesis protein FlhB
VPRARDLSAFASWVAVCAALAWSVPSSLASLESLAASAFSTVAASSPARVHAAVTASLESLASLLAAPLAACFAAVLLAGFLFTGPTFSWHAVSPRLDRLSPAAGLRRIFSTDRWFTVVRDVVKLALLLVIGALCLRAAIRPLLSAPGLDPAAGPILARHLLVHLAALVGAGAAAFALVDAAWSRHAWIKRLRMSHRELRQELRETEGDPSVRGRRRTLHREIAEHRMLEQVRSATFILVNPTRYAVALRWDEDEMDAPEVVASGQRSMARRIIREARRAGVPVLHNPVLARSLSDLEPGETIPEDLYEAVAAIIRVLTEEETSEV